MVTPSSSEARALVDTHNETNARSRCEPRAAKSWCPHQPNHVRLRRDYDHAGGVVGDQRDPAGHCGISGRGDALLKAPSANGIDRNSTHLSQDALDRAPGVDLRRSTAIPTAGVELGDPELGGLAASCPDD